MDAKRRIIALLAILVVTGIFMSMAFYGYYQNFVFFAIIIYFIISSVFFNPKRRNKDVPTKKDDSKSWSSFDQVEDEKATPAQERPNTFAEVFFGERENMQTPQANAEKKKSDNYSGFDDNDHMTNGKTMTKDWGTILYERIRSNATKNDKIIAEFSDDEDYYGGDYNTEEPKPKGPLKFPFKLR